MEDDEERNEVLRRFHEVVRDERAAPELLPFQDELIARLGETVKNEERVIEELAANGEDNFECEIMQMELQRYKYLMKEYYRTRLRKLEANVLAYMDEVKVLEGGQMQSERLSQHEVQYAIAYFQAWARHLNQSTLRFFPEEFHGLHSQRKSNPIKDLVSFPDLDRHVFVRALDDLGSLAEGDELLENVGRGTQWATRFRLVQAAVREGKATLL